MVDSNLNLMVNELYAQWRSLVSDILISNIEGMYKSEGQELLNEMKRIHKKLALAVLTQERNLLAITGEQGSGKTTLIKRLYGLENGYLPENLTRGEQLPVLITESNIESIEGYVWTIVNCESKGIELNSVKLDEDEFCRISREPEYDHVWMELKVPYKHFNTEGTSLILLPGFENDFRVRSQELLEHVLFLSTSSILVIRKDTYARQESTNLMDRIKNIYTGVKPILVASMGDVNPEKNGEFREVLIDDFDICCSEEDRVIISGDPIIYDDQWINNLVDSIQKYCFISDVSYRKYLSMLESLFTEVQITVGKLEDLIEKEEGSIPSEILVSRNNTSRLVSQFESMYERHITKLEEMIKAQLNNKVKLAVDNFDRFILENTGIWKGISSKFSPKALKEQHELENAIMQAWNDAQGDSSEKVLVNTITEYLNQNFLDIAKLLPTTQGTNSLLVEEAINPNEIVENEDDILIKKPFINKVNANVLDKLESFFKWKENDKPVVLSYSEQKAMTMLGIMMCRQSIIANPLIEYILDGEKGEKVNKSSDRSQELFVNPLDNTIKDVNKFAKGIEKLEKFELSILKSIPVILGIDIARDGEADIAINASKALATLGINIGPATLVGVLGVSYVTVFALNSVKKAVNDTNKYQMDLSQQGRRVIDQIPEMQAKAFSNSVRNIFMNMSDMLAEKHRQQLGTYDDYGKIELIRYNINRIRKLNNKLSKEVLDSEVFTW